MKKQNGMSKMQDGLFVMLPVVRPILPVRNGVNI